MEQRRWEILYNYWSWTCHLCLYNKVKVSLKFSEYYLMSVPTKTLRLDTNHCDIDQNMVNQDFKDLLDYLMVLIWPIKPLLVKGKKPLYCATISGNIFHAKSRSLWIAAFPWNEQNIFLYRIDGGIFGTNQIPSRSISWERCQSAMEQWAYWIFR